MGRIICIYSDSESCVSYVLPLCSDDYILVSTGRFVVLQIDRRVQKCLLYARRKIMSKVVEGKENIAYSLEISVSNVQLISIK